jgi:hypothetical protein
MSKNQKPSAYRRALWQKSGAIQTVVTFGKLTITFNNAQQLEVVTHNPPGSFFMDIWVSSITAREQIGIQLKKAGYQLGNPVDRRNSLEYYCTLPKKAECHSCGNLNKTFGIQSYTNKCQGCGKPTKDHNRPVYVCGDGSLIDDHFITSKPLDLPQPLGVLVVLMQ